MHLHWQIPRESIRRKGVTLFTSRIQDERWCIPIFIIEIQFRGSARVYSIYVIFHHFIIDVAVEKTNASCSPRASIEIAVARFSLFLVPCGFVTSFGTSPCAPIEIVMLHDCPLP